MTAPLAYDAARLRVLAGEIVTATRELGAAGRTPANSSTWPSAPTRSKELMWLR